MRSLRSMGMMTAVLATLAMAPAAGWAQCGIGDQLNSDLGNHYLGLRQDGARLGMGQSFELDCRARFDTAAGRIEVDANDPPAAIADMTASDEVIATLLDENLNTLATLTQPLGFDDGKKWLVFDFQSQGIVLEPGTYSVVFHTTVDAFAAISTTGGTEMHPGTRVAYWNGAFSAQPASFGDTDFRVTWNANAVPVETAGWGAVKASFR